MNAISNSTLLQSLGWSVFNSLWQMALLWIAYQLVVALFKIKKSSHRGTLSATFLFAGFGWFVFTFISLLIANPGAQTVYSGGIINIDNNGQLNQWFNSALPVVSVVYLILLLLPVLNFIRNYRYVQVIRRYSLSKADVYWRIFAQKIAAQMGINKQVYVWMSELISSPVTIGYIKPIILLPLSSINHLSTQQIEAVLLHELAHIRRYDYFINLVARFIRTVLYFNPFAGAFGKIIEKEREKSCDETVLQFQYEPYNYASALVTLEKAAYISKQSLAVAAAGSKKGDFTERIEWILGISKKPAFSFARIAGVIIAVFCFAGLNALLIMNKPLNNNGKSDPFTLLSSSFEFSNKADSKMFPAEVTSSPVVNNEPETAPAEQSLIEMANQKSSEESVSLGKHSDLKNELIKEESEFPFPYSYISHVQEIVPLLDEQKEKEVQEAVVESKRVMQETQWKVVEKSIADAMTLIEKNNAKKEYEKVLNKQIDLEKLADQLRLAYDQINWSKINAQLDNAIAEIQMDSLKTVYNIAISNLSDMQTQLVKAKQTGVPDSDISIESIEVKKKELEKAVDKLKTVRPKKTIHL